MRKLLMIVAMVAVIGMAGNASAAIVQDETDGQFSGSGWGPGDGLLTGTPEPAGANNRYLTQYPGTADGYWTPGLTGTYLVEASWATNGNHGHNVDYYFRSDGTAGSAVITLADGIDQKYLNDQATTGSMTWSGYYVLGTFDLTTASVFHIDQDGSWNTGSGSVSTCLWQFSEPAVVVVPEPAGLGLIGLALLAVRRRRS